MCVYIYIISKCISNIKCILTFACNKAIKKDTTWEWIIMTNSLQRSFATPSSRPLQ